MQAASTKSRLPKVSNAPRKTFPRKQSSSVAVNLGYRSWTALQELLFPIEMKNSTSDTTINFFLEFKRGR
ncbi:hypothetical protein DPMN_001781 [Dreissena polymorpha]|uniref:Uncharacterized protein n=1 Tax=Dreissena polymorpha TaxID=45954 RepID=A0A9D4MLY5_DREPO|nr:hypothetical protein DPMN_001781 [Dreissena polymorpha]